MHRQVGDDLFGRGTVKNFEEHKVNPGVFIYTEVSLVLDLVALAHWHPVPYLPCVWLMCGWISHFRTHSCDGRSSHWGSYNPGRPIG